jgi:hypothetical protein
MGIFAAHDGTGTPGGMPCRESAKLFWEAPSGRAAEPWPNAGDIWLSCVEPLAGPLALAADAASRADVKPRRHAKAMDLSLKRVAPLAEEPSDRGAGLPDHMSEGARGALTCNREVPHRPDRSDRLSRA